MESNYSITASETDRTNAEQVSQDAGMLCWITFAHKLMCAAGLSAECYKHNKQNI